MRREGYEFSVSRPEVILREEDDETLEPVERVVADVPASALGSIIEALTQRRGQLVDLQQGETRARAEFQVPSRGLFGFRTSFLSLTAGEGLLSHVFDGYEPLAGEIRTRASGSLVAMEPGEVFAYSLFKLQDRGAFFVEPGTEVYVGMIVGAHSRSGDLEVNLTKNKKLTNVRAAGSDDNIVLTPARPPRSRRRSNTWPRTSCSRSRRSTFACASGRSMRTNASARPSGAPWPDDVLSQPGSRVRGAGRRQRRTDSTSMSAYGASCRAVARPSRISSSSAEKSTVRSAHERVGTKARRVPRSIRRSARRSRRNASSSDNRSCASSK